MARNKELGQRHSLATKKSSQNTRKTDSHANRVTDVSEKMEVDANANPGLPTQHNSAESSEEESCSGIGGSGRTSDACHSPDGASEAGAKSGGARSDSEQVDGSERDADGDSDDDTGRQSSDVPVRDTPMPDALGASGIIRSQVAPRSSRKQPTLASGKNSNVMERMSTLVSGHAVTSKQPAGQNDTKGDQMLRCLPYVTKHRAPKRELIRWNDEMHSHTLLAMIWVLETKGVEIPWEEVSAVVQPGATGEAFKQASIKLRTKRVSDKLPVPPARVGRGKTRRDCEAELQVILSEARELRDAKGHKVGMSSTVTMDVVTSEEPLASQRPSTLTSKNQKGSSGGTTVASSHEAGSGDMMVSRPFALDSARPQTEPGREYPNRFTVTDKEEEVSSTRTTQKSSQAQAAAGHVNATPPTKLRTPEECPPAPRGRTISRRLDESQHRKRPSDDMGLSLSSPESKRRHSDVSHTELSRTPCLRPIPEFGLPNPAAMQLFTNMGRQPYNGTHYTQQQSPFGMQGENGIQMPLPLQRSYPDMQFSHGHGQYVSPYAMHGMMNPYTFGGNMQHCGFGRSNMQQGGFGERNSFFMGGANRMPPPRMEPFQQMQAPRLSAASQMTVEDTSMEGTPTRMNVDSTTAAEVQTPMPQMGSTDSPAGSDESASRPTIKFDPTATLSSEPEHDTSAGVRLSDLLANHHTETAPTADVSALAHAGSTPNAGAESPSATVTDAPTFNDGTGGYSSDPPSSVYDGAYFDSMWGQNGDCDLISPENDTFPTNANQSLGPMSMLYSDESHEYGANYNSFGGDSFVGGIAAAQSTQTSFGSNGSTVEGTRITPAQPRAAGDGNTDERLQSE